MPTVREYPVPPGTHPHDVAPAPDGTVWYTAQHTGKLGRLDPKTGQTTEIPLGEGSAPHGVIVGPDGAPWVTDGGLNAIVRVDPGTSSFRGYRLPASTGYANLNTATFDRRGSSGSPGRAGSTGASIRRPVRCASSAPRWCRPIRHHDDAEGARLLRLACGSHIAEINVRTGKATVIRPPTAGQGARRVWSDSKGMIWVSEWNAGKVGRYDPATRKWREWDVPGPAQVYAVYVDDRDIVWLTDFGRSGLWRFAPRTGRFTRVPLRADASVRQLLGRPGEV